MKNQWKGFILGIFVTLLCVGTVGTAYATVGSKTVQIDYNDIRVILDGQQVNLIDANGGPAEPFAISGTTYLPVRAVANAFGLEVGWDGATRTVILNRPEASRQVYITRTGSRWHYDSHCNGGTYWEVPYSTATGMGLTPCDKCVNK